MVQINGIEQKLRFRRPCRALIKIIFVVQLFRTVSCPGRPTISGDRNRMGEAAQHFPEETVRNCCAVYPYYRAALKQLFTRTAITSGYWTPKVNTGSPWTRSLTKSTTCTTSCAPYPRTMMKKNTQPLPVEMTIETTEKYKGISRFESLC